MTSLQAMRKLGMWSVLLLGWLGIAHSAFAVGYVHVLVPDPSGSPIEVGIWYPSQAPEAQTRLELFEQAVAVGGAIDPAAATARDSALPLVIISHGTGGSYTGHYDTALALARAGFIVAALTHTGDNYRDQSRALMIWDRPRQVSVVLDYLLHDWDQHRYVDGTRIGMFGFSAGGFTTLALVGGIPDLGRIGPHCQELPDEWSCKLIARSAGGGQRPAPPAGLSMRDERIKVAVVAAPALGYAFAPHGLDGVSVPIQLWRAEDDHILPNPWYAQTVRDALPHAPQYHVVAGADHFDFLAPCSASLAAVVPEICSEAHGFDRSAFHGEFNAEVVGFLTSAIGAPAR